MGDIVRLQPKPLDNLLVSDLELVTAIATWANAAAVVLTKRKEPLLPRYRRNFMAALDELNK